METGCAGRALLRALTCGDSTCRGWDPGGQDPGGGDPGGQAGLLERGGLVSGLSSKEKVPLGLGEGHLAPWADGPTGERTWALRPEFVRELVQRRWVQRLRRRRAGSDLGRGEAWWAQGAGALRVPSG